MVFRPKLFFKFFAVCVVPLLLLAAFNYWNDVRVADAALNRVHASALSDFNNGFNRALNEDREALKRFSGCKVVVAFIADRAEQIATQPPADSATFLATDAVVIPADLDVRVVDVVNSRNHFAAVSLFGAAQETHLCREAAARGS